MPDPPIIDLSSDDSGDSSVIGSEELPSVGFGSAVSRSRLHRERNQPKSIGAPSANFFEKPSGTRRADHYSHQSTITYSMPAASFSTESRRARQKQLAPNLHDASEASEQLEADAPRWPSTVNVPPLGSVDVTSKFTTELKPKQAASLGISKNPFNPNIISFGSTPKPSIPKVANPNSPVLKPDPNLMFASFDSIPALSHMNKLNPIIARSKVPPNEISKFTSAKRKPISPPTMLRKAMSAHSLSPVKRRKPVAPSRLIPYASESNIITEKQILESIPDNASCVFHVMDRRVNLDMVGADASLYSLIRCWVQDDPARHVPPPGTNIMEYNSVDEEHTMEPFQKIEDYEETKNKVTTSGIIGVADTRSMMKNENSASTPVDILKVVSTAKTVPARNLHKELMQRSREARNGKSVKHLRSVLVESVKASLKLKGIVLPSRRK